MPRALNLTKLRETIGFYPHEKQIEILRNQKKFTIVVGGRRVGKTILAAYVALRELFLNEKNVWIVAPTHDLSGRIWEYLEKWTDEKFPGMFQVNRHEKILKNTMTKSNLWAKTAENPDSLRGKGLSLAIVDEAAIIPNGIYDAHIKANLLDGGKGRAFLISNPFGFNWFYDFYLHGTPEGRKSHPDHISFVVPTAIEDEEGNVIGTNNPASISVEDLKEVKRTTPIDIWKQEYLSVFQEGAGQRFKDYEKCIDDTIILYDGNEWFEDPRVSHLYYVGVDIAKVEDFTVITVIDRMNHRLVGFYRINNTSWDYMRQKVKDIAERYNYAEVVIDATGTGGSVFTEDLLALGVNINTGFNYTNAKKLLLIDKLAVLMERGKLRFPRIPQLINEIRSFSYHFSNSGNLIYGTSRKDDCVNSLALACWNLNEEPLGDVDEMNIPFIPKRRRFT